MKFLWVLFSVSLFLNLHDNIIFASDLDLSLKAVAPPAQTSAFPELEAVAPPAQTSAFPENVADPRILEMLSSKHPLDSRFEIALMEGIHDKTIFEMLWKLRLKLSRTSKPFFWRYANNLFANPKVDDCDFLIDLLTPEKCLPWPKVLARLQRRKDLLHRR